MLHLNVCSTRFALIILYKGQFLVLMYFRIRINRGTPASLSPFSVPQMFYILPVSVPISLALWPHFDTSSTVSSFIFFKWANHPRLFLPVPVLPLLPSRSKSLCSYVHFYAHFCSSLNFSLFFLLIVSNSPL